LGTVFRGFRWGVSEGVGGCFTKGCVVCAENPARPNGAQPPPPHLRHAADGARSGVEAPALAVLLAADDESAAAAGWGEEGAAEGVGVSQGVRVAPNWGRGGGDWARCRSRLVEGATATDQNTHTHTQTN
jgi:hypothetical protein